jgi:two-component system phosphate regulon sensor histidine kinase PhoR
MARSKNAPDPWTEASQPQTHARANRSGGRAAKRWRRRDSLPSISLELKGPLSSIRSASQTVAKARAGALSRKQEKMLRIITEESSALVCLIEDLLDMAEIESGKLALKFRRCSLTEVARASLDRQRPRARQKGIELLDSLPALCPMVQADAPRLRQVFDYLISNAMKFTPPGGSVELKIRKDEASSRKTRSRPALLISVSDTGERIPGNELAGVFGTSRQDTGRSARAGGGTGLGLSFARFLVEAHGGEIWAESPGVTGATFVFSLPIAR